MECMDGDKPGNGRAVLAVLPEQLSKDVHTAMHAKYVVVNHDGERQEVKHVCEVRPHMRRAVFPHAFRVEAIRLQVREPISSGEGLERDKQTCVTARDSWFPLIN